jgi:hypothetical protein
MSAQKRPAAGEAPPPPAFPTLADWRAALQALNRRFDETPRAKRDPREMRALLVKYLKYSTVALWRAGIGPPHSCLVYELMEALIDADNGRKNTLFHTEAPLAPRGGNRARGRAFIEGYAAAILDCMSLHK